MTFVKCKECYFCEKIPDEEHRKLDVYFCWQRDRQLSVEAVENGNKGCIKGQKSKEDKHAITTTN